MIATATAVRRENRTVNLAIYAGILGLFVLLAVLVYSATREPSVEVGDTAPGFTLKTDNGLTISNKDFGGRLLILNFWATWCEPCVAEVPSLNELQKLTADSGVVVVGVSIDRNEQRYKEFLKRFNVTFQTSRDPEANLSARFGTYKVPETYIIGRDGKVIEKFISNRDWADPQLVSFLKARASS